MKGVISMKKIKEYYQEHKDSIKNATICSLMVTLAFTVVCLNAADHIIKDNNLLG